MQILFVILITATLAGCASYKGSEFWRRSVCEELIDVDERARCLEEASRPESDYKQDVEDAKGNDVF